MKHLSTWLALCALTAFSATALAETSKQPNIVLLISDDDDYEHFGFMGSKIAQTPTLDKLVAGGTLFKTAHCPAPLCRPSLASMLTGRMPHQHGIYGNYLEKGGIGNDRIKLDPAGSLANRLKGAGYVTYATGKYWEGDLRAMGFTHGTADVTIKGFKQFVREGQDELFQFIDDQHKKKPMFIWWAPLLPHGPYNPPPKYFDRFADTKIPIPSFYKGDRKEYVATMRKFYAMGTWFDDGVAQLIEKLKAAGEYENTLFLFYVDNGVTFGMPGKNSPTEKGLRTPVFVTWPGTVPAGKRIDSLNYALDLHATALDYAGIKVPADIASKSLRPQIEGKTKRSHDALFGAVYAHQPHKYSGDPSIKRSAERDVYALYTRTERWKYVLYTQDLNEKNARYIAMGLSLTGPFTRDQGQQELFDLDVDPYEQKDLSAKAVHRKRVAAFRKQTLDWWKRAGGGPLQVATHNRVKQSIPVYKAKPRAEEGFFNGKNLTGWEIDNDVGVWSVKEGAIVATSGDKDMPNLQFLWNKTAVKNFHLSLMVKQTPYEANGGIQFRSARLEKGLAHGYQADVGKDWWGTLYHEHGRRVLGRRADSEGKNIKREGWNHYEILAVGQRVWLAVNGKITVALRDKFGESEGQIALQAHSGIPQTVAYKELKLIHDPKVELVGMNEAALNKLLVDAPKMGMSPREYLNPGSAPADDGKKAPRKGGAVGINALIKQLDLNADQKKKLAEFNQANHENLATALKLKGDEKTAAMRKINQARNAKLKEILTEEQAAKLKELQAKARANNKKRKEVEAPPTAIPPKPRPPPRKNQGGNTPKTIGKLGKQNKPNVILIMSDDMGYSDLPKFGKSEIPTPNIDRLAKEGTLFTDAYVTAPICVASRMGLLSGQFQQRFGIYDNIYGEDKTRLFLNQTLLPAVFQDAGYRTAHVGKWHLSGNSRLQYETAGPRDRGFDESVAIRGGGSSFWKGTPVFRNGKEFPAPEYLTDLWGTEACAFIDRAHAQPFFLYLAYNAVHSPMHALDGDRAKFPKVKDENRRTYDGMLLAMDRSIGRVLDRLDKHSIADNTIVVFLNDNGGGGSTDLYAAHSRNYANNKPLRGHKFDVLEGGVRVPMIIRWPKHAPAGKIYSEMVSSTDVYPTLVACAGLQMPKGQPVDGVDLFPFINGKKGPKPHEWLCWQNRSWQPRKKGGFVVPTPKVHNSAIRKGNWKLVRLNEKIGADTSPPAWKLYDLTQDIGEQKDLAGKHREVVKELDAHFEKWRSSMHPTLE